MANGSGCQIHAGNQQEEYLQEGEESGANQRDAKA